MMRKALGEQESMTVELIFGLITKFSGQEHSDLLKKHFFNIIGKAWVLYQQGIAALDEVIAPLREPNFLFACYFLEQLNIKVPSERNIPGVQLLIAEATSKLIGMLPLLFKEETVDKAIRIIELFVDISFLDFVLKNPVNQRDCEVLRISVSAMLSGTVTSDNFHNSSMMLRRSLLIRSRCLSELIAAPKLTSFLRSEEASVLLWVYKANQLNL